MIVGHDQVFAGVAVYEQQSQDLKISPLRTKQHIFDISSKYSFSTVYNVEQDVGI
jgi:hypothetical protein